MHSELDGSLWKRADGHPDLWEQVDLAAKKPPYQEFADYLKTADIKAPVVKTIF